MVFALRLSTKARHGNPSRLVAASLGGNAPKTHSARSLFAAAHESAFGTKRRSRHDQSMSAFGGKADVTRTCPDVRFRPKADIGDSPLNLGRQDQIGSSPSSLMTKCGGRPLVSKDRACLQPCVAFDPAYSAPGGGFRETSPPATVYPGE